MRELLLTEDELKQLTPEELADLEFACKEAIREIEDQYFDDFVEAKLDPKMELMRARYFNNLDQLTDALQSGVISQNTFNKRMQELITTNFEDAYALHRGAALDAGDRAYLQRATQAEMKYATQFGDDIVNGRLRMPRVKRAELYAQTLDGVGWNAMIEKFPNSVRIQWVLGTAEHCKDCIALASSGPYTKWTLPTTPRAGGTRCVSNCKCKLTFQGGRLTKKERASARKYAQKKEMSVLDMLMYPTPEDLRPPTPIEARYIDELRTKMNYQRRRIAQLPKGSDEAQEAIALRRKFNDELIEFLEKNKVHDVPVFSVEEVLDETVIGRKAVDDLMRAGMDGKTLNILEAKKLSRFAEAFKEAVAGQYSESAIVEGLDEATKIFFADTTIGSGGAPGAGGAGGAGGTGGNQ